MEGNKSKLVSHFWRLEFHRIQRAVLKELVEKRDKVHVTSYPSIDDKLLSSLQFKGKLQLMVY